MDSDINTPNYVFVVMLHYNSYAYSNHVIGNTLLTGPRKHYQKMFGRS